MRFLRFFFWFTDTGFVAYWLITLSGVIPDAYLFKDYRNEILNAWNWSFFPLDIFISVSGYLSLYFHRRGLAVWKRLALISLVLTFCSGLQALSFWTLRRDFDLTWWIPNLYLLLYPLFFIPRMMKDARDSSS